MLNVLACCLFQPSLLHNWLVFFLYLQVFENTSLKLIMGLYLTTNELRWLLSLLCMHIGSLQESMELVGDGQE